MGNDIDSGDIGYNSQALAHEVSYEIFGKTCADIIESLYESGFVKTVVLTSNQYKSWDTYVNYLPVALDKRMKAIYQNIIDNKGFLKIGRYKF